MQGALVSAGATSGTTPPIPEAITPLVANEVKSGFPSPPISLLNPGLPAPTSPNGHGTLAVPSPANANPVNTFQDADRPPAKKMKTGYKFDDKLPAPTTVGVGPTELTFTLRYLPSILNMNIHCLPCQTNIKHH